MKSRKLRKSTRKIIITMHSIHSVLHKKVFCLTGFRKDEYWMWFWAWNNWFNRFNFIASGHERSWAMPMIRLLLQLRWFFFLSQFINNYLRVLQHQRNFFLYFLCIAILILGILAFLHPFQFAIFDNIIFWQVS